MQTTLYLHVTEKTISIEFLEKASNKTFNSYTDLYSNKTIFNELYQRRIQIPSRQN